MCSPVFQKENIEHKYAKTIRFEAGKSIRRVQSSSNAADFTYSIFFLDGAGNEVYSYKPGGGSKNGPAFDIAENEEIFGVYGVKDKKNYFTSFGFIVKKK